MIRHFVHLRFRDDVSDQEKEAIYRDLAGLSNHISGIIDFQHRENISVETALMRGFNAMFWFDVETLAVRDAYLVDEKHQAVGANLVNALEGGMDGLFVCDIAL